MKKYKKQIMIAGIVIMLISTFLMGRMLLQYGEYQNVRETYTEQLQTIISNYESDYHNEYLVAKTKKEKLEVRDKYEAIFYEAASLGENELSAIHKRIKDSEQHYINEARKYKEECDKIINKGLEFEKDGAK